ncbi:hypothetical protein O1R50_16745 [Glycomyces luteolus]|uniref:Uncharacterized protein n=1 Tax=Glycomyces luteolus TaxID=2670330 RepID=A0A9X3PM97_9ACTN|nr:hypothetical protein [Glycomyces luteolus]MDA1361280.1 hypothetical protein [Glycomyces luteolus]
MKSSGGASVLPAYRCTEDLASGEIVALLEPEIPPINTLSLAARSGGPKPSWRPPTATCW